MSAATDLQSAIEDLLSAPGALRVPVRILARKEKALLGRIEEASARKEGLFLLLMPVKPLRVTQGAPFVFFEAAEVAVRIIEQVQVNMTGADAYDLRDDVMQCLHWQPREPGTRLGEILAHPLQLAERPTAEIEDAQTRMIDVFFHATFGFQPSE